MGTVKCIGILTSGGDAPGMNAAIRAVTRAAIYNGLQVKGIYRGYKGLVTGEIKEFKSQNVSNIIQLGGTILKTARCKEFTTPEGRQLAYDNMKKDLADAPLDKVPVFIKAGAIIPVADGEIRSTEDITEDKISILTYPGKSSFVHYQDDNETFAYRDGEYNAVEYTLDGDKLEKRVLHKGL